MSHHSLFRAAARCWERAGHFDRAAERYARAEAWSDAGRCWAQAGRPVDAAAAYARAGEPIREARQWLASPWPERARRPYQQGLETGLSTADEVEALLGLGEIELASERAFTVASENGRAVEALCSLARIAAARGRPDLAAHAWGQAMGWSPAGAREVFENWERSAPWNRSLGWRRPPPQAPGWPSRDFRDVRLELVWEEKLGSMMIGNRALAWSPDGRRFAASKHDGALILGNLTAQGIRHRSVKGGARSVAFIPGSGAVLAGCDGGRVVRVDPSGAAEELEALRMPASVWGVAFSPQGDRLAISGGPAPGELLRVFAWESHTPQTLLREETVQQDRTNPSLSWSPDGRILAWCPGPWSEESILNDLYLFSEGEKRCASAVHENGVESLAFSPDGRYLATASMDRTLALRDPHTGEAVAPLWSCVQRLMTVVFHPHAALIAAGGAEDFRKGFERPGRLYLLRISQTDSPHFEVIQESATETAVNSLAFSPDGEHLLMSTNDRLYLFRVHLI